MVYLWFINGLSMGFQLFFNCFSIVFQWFSRVSRNLNGFQRFSRVSRVYKGFQRISKERQRVSDSK